MGERRGAYRILVGRLEGKSLLGRPRCRWEDNVKIDLRELWLGLLFGLIWVRIGAGG
jgi:hypothetical protein